MAQRRRTAPGYAPASPLFVQVARSVRRPTQYPELRAGSPRLWLEFPRDSLPPSRRRRRSSTSTTGPAINGRCLGSTVRPGRGSHYRWLLVSFPRPRALAGAGPPQSWPPPNLSICRSANQLEERGSEHLGHVPNGGLGASLRSARSRPPHFAGSRCSRRADLTSPRAATSRP
jgi:hypothetical protein